MRLAVSRCRALRAPALAALPLALALSGCGTGAPSAGAGGADAPGALASGEPAAPSPRRRCTEPLEAESERARGLLPRQLGGLCLDAYARVRAFGSDEREPVGRACDELLGLGCGDSEEQGLEHVVGLRYSDAAGGAAALDVVAMRFADAPSAYGHFTEQLIGERDPLELGATVIPAPGVAVLDGAHAAGWLGRYVVSANYSDESAPTAERARDVAARLPELFRGLLEALPNEPTLPLAVQKLPASNRIPLGVRLVQGDAFGVRGIGPGALGYYREGDKRWRVLSIVRPDADSAKDVLGTLGQNPAARPIRNAPLDALSFNERRLPREPHVGWVVGQRREVIYGVGDEATALPELTTAEREAAVKLSLLDKLAKLTRIDIE